MKLVKILPSIRLMLNYNNNNDDDEGEEMDNIIDKYEKTIT